MTADTPAAGDLRESPTPTPRPADPAVLRDLLERVHAATGPDREIDAEVWWLFADHKDDDPSVAADVVRLGVIGAMDAWWGKTWRLSHEVHRVTDSLDATLALVERVLPDWKWTLGTEKNASFIHDAAHAAVMDRDWPDPLAGDGLWFDGHAETPPLAILAALLTALLATTEPHHADAE